MNSCYLDGHRVQFRLSQVHCKSILSPNILHQFSSVQSLSHVQLFATPWTTARQASLSITNSWNLPKFMSIESVMHPTISSSVVPSPPAFNLSQHQGLFKRVSSLHQVAKILEFQLQHQSFQWTPRTDFSIICFLFRNFELLAIKSCFILPSLCSSYFLCLEYLFSPILYLVKACLSFKF